MADDNCSYLFQVEMMIESVSDHAGVVRSKIKPFCLSQFDECILDYL